MGTLTPEELIKLCDAAEAESPDCDCVLVGPNFIHQARCAKWDARHKREVALDELFELDFNSSARARSYAALWEKLEKGPCWFRNNFGAATIYNFQRCADDPDCQRCEALATTGGTHE